MESNALLQMQTSGDLTYATHFQSHPELLTTVTVGLSNCVVAVEVGTLKVLHCAVELLLSSSNVPPQLLHSYSDLGLKDCLFHKLYFD